MKIPLQRVSIALATGFSLILAGQAKAQTFTNLHNFSALDPATQTTNVDGANPYAGLVLSGNILYGTAQYGGTNGNGTVFMVNTNGTGFAVLHTFTGLDPTTSTNTDGADPTGGLILSGNSLYGTASAGGNSDNGTVFKVNTDGTGFTTVYNFTGGNDGGYPEAGLVLSGGILYGTGAYGGDSGYGSVFAVNTNGTGFTNVYSFSAVDYSSSGYYTNGDGAYPLAGLILSGSILYGTANEGGTNGSGTVFKVNTNGTGFAVLHTFTGLDPTTSTNTDGADPTGGLILSGNSLYGTASAGGNSDNGTVFKVNTDGTGFTTVYNFTGGNDGGYPEAGLVLSGGILYGTAAYGGDSSHGTVFAVNTNGATFTLLYAFSGYPNDGDSPAGTLNLSGNTVYGTTQFGGGENSGTIFSLPTNNVFSVFNCDTVQINNTNLPVGLVSIYYDQFLNATSCYPSFTWSLNSGSLPPGLQMSADGEVSGTPTNGGMFNFSAHVVDGNNHSTTQPIALNIITPPSTMNSVSDPSFTNGLFQFNLGGASGQNITVQFSTNLLDWVTLLSTNLPGGSTTLSFTPGTNQAGFYRAYESGLLIESSTISASAPSYSVSVTNTSATVTLIRSGSLADDIYLTYGTSDGTARAGVDYTPVSGTLHFGPGQTSAGIVVPLLPGAEVPDTALSLRVNFFATNGTALAYVPIVIRSGTLFGYWYGSWVLINNVSPTTNLVVTGGNFTLQVGSLDFIHSTVPLSFYITGDYYGYNYKYCTNGSYGPIPVAYEVFGNVPFALGPDGHVSAGMTVYADDTNSFYNFNVGFDFDTIHLTVSGGSPSFNTEKFYKTDCAPQQDIWSSYGSIFGTYEGIHLP